MVRRTNKRIICQIIHATLTGDKCLCSADSFDLRNHGLKAGLTNYSAAYCTGLLAGRRLLTAKNMADKYEGNNKVNGEYYSVIDSQDEDHKPFKAFLDVGLVRTTTGNRVFGAMKGACDGGLNIPHGVKRFPGSHTTKAEVITNKRGKAVEQEKAKTSFDPKEHREHIFGTHVQNYYNVLKADNQQRFKKQFANWEKALGGKTFEQLYKSVHASIRKNPAKAGNKAKPYKPKAASEETGFKTYVCKSKGASNGGKWLRYRRLTD